MLSFVQKHASRFAPLFYVFISGAGYSLQAALVKVLKLDGYDGAYQCVLARGLSQSLLCLYLIYASPTFAEDRKVPLLGPTYKVTCLLLARALAGYGGVTFKFLSVQLLPVGDAAVLTMLGPAFAALLGVFVLGEPWWLPELVSTVMSLGGTALVCKPTFVFGNDAVALDTVGVLFALCSAFSAGCGYILIRLLGTSAKMPWPHICFIQAVAQVVGAVPSFLANVPLAVLSNTTAYQMTIILLGGLIGCLSQISMTVGMQREKSAAASGMRMSEIVFAYFWQVTLTNDGLELMSLSGAAVIVVSLLIIIYHHEDHGNSHRESSLTLEQQSTELSESQHKLVGNAYDMYDYEEESLDTYCENDDIDPSFFAEETDNSTSEVLEMTQFRPLTSSCTTAYHRDDFDNDVSSSDEQFAAVVKGLKRVTYDSKS